MKKKSTKIINMKNKENKQNLDSKNIKRKIIFGLNGIPDQLPYQCFTFLVFTFYFAVVGLNMNQMWIGYSIWGIWNAINDPLLGALSDRRIHKGGKRKFFIIIAIIPLCFIMIFLFTAPLSDNFLVFIYFLFIIMLFEGIYTLYQINVKALFPEMFPTEKERATTNLFVKGFTIIALIFAFIVPTVIISPMVPLPTSTPEEIAQIPFMYVTTGILLAIITAIASFVFITFGIEEKGPIREDFEKIPPFFESIKMALKNKNFVKLVLANLAIWYVFSILPTIFPLYGVFVLGIEKESLLIGLSLMFAFLIAGIIMPVHRKIGQKIGMRNSLILTCIIWICTLFPYVLLFDNEIIRIFFIILTALQGFSLSGAIYYFDILIGDIIDEDELKTGVRKAGSYYGVSAFIHRFSTILNITSIAIVFAGTGWSEYVPVTGDPLLTIIGLKTLVFIFPAFSLLVAIIFMKWYGLHGEKLNEMRKKLEEKKNE